MIEKNKKIKILNILLQIPCTLVVSISALLLLLGEKINILATVLSIILLFISGYCLMINNKRTNILALISILIFTIWYCIMGYFDYMQWVSTIIGIAIFIYYGIIYLLKRKISKK